MSAEPEPQGGDKSVLENDVVMAIEEEGGVNQTFTRILEHDCSNCGCNRAVWLGARSPSYDEVKCAACKDVVFRG